jgi:lipopolysaccharide transport system permease protein
MRAIEPPTPGLRRYFSQLWLHRPALQYYVRVYVRKRTQRTFLGYLWFVIPLILPLIVGTLVFGTILRVHVGNIPYFLYFTVANGTWIFFLQTAYFSTRSIEISRRDLRRIYVPRLAVFSTAVTIGAITLFVYVVFAAGTAVYFLITKGTTYLQASAATLLVPVGLIMLVVLAWSWALWTAPLAPRARDVRRFTHYVLGWLLFFTPVIYPIQNVPSGLRFLVTINPLTAPVEMVKHGVFGSASPPATGLGLAAYAASLVLIGVPGFRFFARQERRDMAFY